MNLKAVKKVNIGDQVCNRIGDQIMSGVWAPGEKIPSENQLMEVFGVNRGTTRQVIQKLSAVELLETRKGEGSYVGQLGLVSHLQSAVPATFLNEGESKEVFEFRMLFECRVTEMATENAADVQIRKLEKNYRKMLQNLGNSEKYIEIDLEPHCLLRECTHNTLVCQMYKITEDTPAMSVKEGMKAIRLEYGKKDHGLVLKVVQNHDSQTVREVTRHHVIDYPALTLDIPVETKVDSLVRHT